MSWILATYCSHTTPFGKDAVVMWYNSVIIITRTTLPSNPSIEHTPEKELPQRGLDHWPPFMLPNSPSTVRFLRLCFSVKVWVLSAQSSKVRYSRLATLIAYVGAVGFRIIRYYNFVTSTYIVFRCSSTRPSRPGGPSSRIAAYTDRVLF
jgi:hypothetical protein